MKSRMLVAGMAIIALAALSGCAGGVNATKSIEFADSNKTIAQEANVDVIITASISIAIRRMMVVFFIINAFLSRIL